MDDYCAYFKKKKITLMGLGLLGRGAGDAKFLAECGADLIVTDLKKEKDLAPSLKKLRKFKNIKFVLGRHRLQDFKNRDMILKAAGVPLGSPYIKEAKKNNIPVEMDASLFSCLAPKGVKIIGVTGTRGKSTVTSLLYDVFKMGAPRRRSGQKDARSVFLGGNVRGMATLPLADKVKSGDTVVMELDSWQLQGFGEAKISPRLAIFTNFMPDHMNYYKGNMRRYFNDKANIFRFQKKEDCLITTKKVKEAIRGRLKGRLLIAEKSGIPKNWKIKVPGEHNLENISLAIAAARELGVNDIIIKKAVENFRGVPARIELVAKKDGIEYYNDTTSTMPEAAMAAIKALKNKGKLILIAGGFDKKLDYAELAREVKKSVKSLVLFEGIASEKIRIALGARYKPVAERVKTMKLAVKSAKSEAKKGDIILLSPGAASFGLFKNEFDRGDQFNKYVKHL